MPSTTGKCSKCQTPGQKNSLLAYYYNRQGAKWPGAEPDNKKSASITNLMGWGIPDIALPAGIEQPEKEIIIIRKSISLSP